MSKNTERHSYEIGARTFEVRAPVLGQVLFVARLLGKAGNELAKVEQLDAAALIERVDEDLPMFLAGVLFEDGKPLRGKARADLAEFLGWEAGEVPAEEILADFFNLPGVPERFQTAAGARDKMVGHVAVAIAQAKGGAMSKETPSEPSSSSPAVTSPGGS